MGGVMETCEHCGKEFKNKAGLSGHLVAVHGRHSVEAQPGLSQVVEGLKVTLDDLCEDCQAKVKEHLFEDLKRVQVVVTKGSGEGLLGLWRGLVRAVSGALVKPKQPTGQA